MQQKENIEYRIRNVEGSSYMAEEKLHHSKSLVRYSLRAYGKFIILELPDAEELAKRLQFRRFRLYRMQVTASGAASCRSKFLSWESMDQWQQFACM